MLGLISKALKLILYLNDTNFSRIFWYQKTNVFLGYVSNSFLSVKLSINKKSHGTLQQFYYITKNQINDQLNNNIYHYKYALYFMIISSIIIPNIENFVLMALIKTAFYIFFIS
jgi:hypothetical protein